MSIVSKVDAEFRVEATEAIVAAMKLAMTSPMTPAGSRWKISVGYTEIRRGPGADSSRMAQVPGSTIRNSTGSFSSPASSTPRRPFSTSCADSTRWTMNWFVHQ